MAHPFEAHHILNLRAPCDSIRPPNVSGKRPASSFSQNGNSNSRNGEAPIPVCSNSSLAAGGSGVPTCVGKDNKKVSWGRSSDVGKRSGMEDSLAIVPGFMSLSCKQVGGCTAPECTYAAEDSPVHFFGLYDGHGGPQVSCYCARMLHEMVAEEWERGGGDEWSKRWEVALRRAYGRADDALKDKALAPYSVGSTSLVVVVSPCQIIAANCGDSRAVLCRGTQAIPLTVDHKLDRQDELARIEEAGGQILYWQGPRVEGVLSMTRAIGDHYLKPWIISEPEVAFTTRSDEDECLILASDGLWDVLSNEQVVKVARNSLREERRKALLNDSSLPPAHSAADSLLCCTESGLVFLGGEGVRASRGERLILTEYLDLYKYQEHLSIEGSTCSDSNFYEGLDWQASK
ncbi:hypothetical protein VitviT2T_013344 [Vitis vinifera]|uniref:protein-serine/threonine phosphatase n=1 Tax=Vitis vinifera TaxID=29760 RepID=A0ABY9CIW0_VITVI|nr:hypothetical protein VitviT2T_013344 [Vitis vinifera]